MPGPALSLAFCLAVMLLAPLAAAGVALINTGLGRSRSAAHAMTSSLCAVGIAGLVYLAFGFKLEGYPLAWESVAGASHGILREPVFFLQGKDNGYGFLPVLLGIFSVGLSALIPLGAAADRWRLIACSLSTVFLAGLTYPAFSHLAGTGFLARLANSNLAHGYLDNGGAGAIQVTGGLTALSVVWLLGPRRGKYSSSGMPAAIPAHNGVYVLFGCMLGWVGWLGLNAARAMVYGATAPEGAVAVALNTSLAAGTGALAAAATTGLRFRRPDASLIANGWMAGLVASSAGCATLTPFAASLTGLLAGILVVLSVEWFELRLKVDDPCGSISVHAVAGIWGILAAGIFSGAPGQLLAQLVGVATLLGFTFPMTYGLNWALARFVRSRVSTDGERQGLDLYELGADAYPEFVVHADEFVQR